MFKLYTDKNENFTAEVSVKNASLKNSSARLIVEADNVSLVFKGTIQDQQCVIPIRKLKGILEENEKGKMYLEIIVEDTYFKPWESEFVVEEHTSMKVVVKEQIDTSKPVLEVKVAEPKKEVIAEKVEEPVKKPQPKKAVKETPRKKNMLESMLKLTPADELLSVCKAVGLKEDASRAQVLEVLQEYFNSNPEYVPNKKEIIREFFSKSNFSSVKE